MDEVGSSDCYTLLADDSSAFASDPKYRRGFKAHIVLNVILNDGIVFSDNQAICATNLRDLANEDGVIRELFKEKRLGLAIRQGGGENPDAIMPLVEVNNAFEREGKIRPGRRHMSGTGDLEFMERHARVIPWPYREVRANFTRTSESVMRTEFGRLLSDADFQRFEDLLEAGRMAELDGGLGRAFLQDRLPEAMTKAGIGRGFDLKSLMKTFTDAAYVSNLPTTIGLNPIYSNEHAGSFALLRGGERGAVDIGGPTTVAMKLDHVHFIEGVNWLSLDDIEFLRNCEERRTYLRLAQQVGDDARRLDEVALAYTELNLRIEDRIISCRPDLLVHSPAADRRQIRKRVMTGIDHVWAATDCLMLDWDWMGRVGELCAVMSVKIIFDAIRARIENDGARPYLDHAKHTLQVKRLRDYLTSHNVGETLALEETVIESSSFAKEIVVS